MPKSGTSTGKVGPRGGLGRSPSQREFNARQAQFRRTVTQNVRRTNALKAEISRLSGRVGDAVARRFGASRNVGDGRDLASTAPKTRQRIRQLESRVNALERRNDRIQAQWSRYRNRWQVQASRADRTGA